MAYNFLPQTKPKQKSIENMNFVLVINNQNLEANFLLIKNFSQPIKKQKNKKKQKKKKKEKKRKEKKEFQSSYIDIIKYGTDYTNSKCQANIA